MVRQIGVVNTSVARKLPIAVTPGSPIFIGQDTIEHIKEKHPDDYNRYFDKVTEIIAAPDYVSIHPDNSSLQFVKIWNNKYILLAARFSAKGNIYAKTMFTMTPQKVALYKLKQLTEKSFIRSIPVTSKNGV